MKRKQKTWLNQGVMVRSTDHLIRLFHKAQRDERAPKCVMFRGRPMPFGFILSMHLYYIARQIAYGYVYTAVRKPVNPRAQP